MYSRSQTSQLKQEFWIAFGRYMSLHPGSEGAKINWLNYHTGYKYVHFKMDAGKKSTVISIEFNHPDALMRELYYDKLTSFRSIIHNALNEEWTWEKKSTDEHGKIISKIYTEMQGVNVYDKNTWPEIISFLKPRIIALDEVWNDIKDAFEELR